MCLPENVPSRSSISRGLKHDLGYSYKKISVIPQESLTHENENTLFEYLTVCATIDPRTMHFFDESSVVKTTGNRHYGHSRIGHPALEVQRYASNATFTVNICMALGTSICYLGLLMDLNFLISSQKH